jgi:2-polyprenyl-6-methoxyphenol hydroxylase-like FAD-dependent oxidoreductase
MRGALDIAVVGCGTAGAAAALLLARAGHTVTLYERVPNPGPVGAGILLQPTGQAVLGRLGLRGDVVARGAPLDGLRIETLARRTLAHLTYADLDRTRTSVGMHRGVLFASLFAAVLAAPIALRLGVGIRDLSPARRGCQHLVDEQGALHGPHELVVVADGARSQLRDDTDRLLPKTVRAYPWGALWFVGKDAAGVGARRLHQVVHGTRRMGGLLPTGVGPDPTNATPLLSLFWSMRAADVEAWRASSLEAWKEEVRRYFPDAGALLEQIERHDDVLFAAYHDVAMPRWHTRNVVYIGDAGHAMSPQLGQGCNLALYDAMVLADCIADHATLDTALACYSSERQAHLAFYQLATRWLTPFFQSDYTPLAWLRDTFMGLASRMPFVRRLMIEVMFGAKCGVFSRLEP